MLAGCPRRECGRRGDEGSGREQSSALVKAVDNDERTGLIWAH